MSDEQAAGKAGHPGLDRSSETRHRANDWIYWKDQLRENQLGVGMLEARRREIDNQRRQIDLQLQQAHEKVGILKTYESRAREKLASEMWNENLPPEAAPRAPAGEKFQCSAEDVLQGQDACDAAAKKVS